MAALTGPNLGISYGWTEGESNWKTLMDANLLVLDGVLGLGIIDRDLTAPPGGESNGDRYIPAATATGAWATHEDEIAVYVAGGWVFHVVPVGTLAYIVDEDVLCALKSGGWSTGISI